MERKNSNGEKKNRRKPLLTTHTKGYCRFAKDFPSVTDSEGYRDNNVFVNSPAKKASVKRRLAIVFVLCFAAAYCVTMLAFTVSKLPVEGIDEEPTDNFVQSALSGYNAAYLLGDILSLDSAESTISELKTSGIDTVVIDFKDAEGHLYFTPSISVSAEALYKASPDAKKIVSELKEADITVFARVACFADDIYCRNNRDDAAYVMTAPQSGSGNQVRTMWYNSGDDSHAWLSPYSNEVLYYLRTIATDVASVGVDGIIFDYVALPADAQSSGVFFSSETEALPDLLMADFITTLNSVYLNCITGVVVSPQSAVTAIEEQKAPFAASSGCDFLVVDLRLNEYPENTALGTTLFKKPALSPEEFTELLLSELQALLLADEEPKDTEIVPLIQKEYQEKQKIGLQKADVKSYIMFSK